MLTRDKNHLRQHFYFNTNTGIPASGEQQYQSVQPLDSFGSAPQALISSETGHRHQCHKGFPAHTNKFITIMCDINMLKQ